MNPILAILINTFLLVAALGVLLLRDWRWRIGSLALMYMGVFVIIIPFWPLELGAVKLVAGWMVATVLGYTRLNLEMNIVEPVRWPTGGAFRVFAAGLVVLVVFGVAPSLASWAAPISSFHAWGALLLIGLGLLNAGLSDRPLPGILGLLMVFAGFEVLYAAVEASTLVAGLLATINLGVALVGAYIMMAPGMEALE
jgi:hypothetical protein